MVKARFKMSSILILFEYAPDDLPCNFRFMKILCSQLWSFAMEIGK